MSYRQWNKFLISSPTSVRPTGANPSLGHSYRKQVWDSRQLRYRSRDRSMVTMKFEMSLCCFVELEVFLKIGKEFLCLSDFQITNRVPTASITYNDRIITTLVESGYIGQLFPKEWDGCTLIDAYWNDTWRNWRRIRRHHWCFCFVYLLPTESCSLNLAFTSSCWLQWWGRLYSLHFSAPSIARFIIQLEIVYIPPNSASCDVLRRE